MRPRCLLPFRLVVAPFKRDALLFIRNSGWNPSECKIVTELGHLRGMRFRGGDGRPPNNGWEVWWLAGHWPGMKWRDVHRQNELYTYLRYVAGADIRHWYT